MLSMLSFPAYLPSCMDALTTWHGTCTIKHGNSCVCGKPSALSTGTDISTPLPLHPSCLRSTPSAMCRSYCACTHPPVRCWLALMWTRAPWALTARRSVGLGGVPTVAGMILCSRSRHRLLSPSLHFCLVGFDGMQSSPSPAQTEHSCTSFV